MAPIPASTRIRIISSVAYADELMLSLLKMASAFVFVSRSCSSRSLLIGRPMRNVRRARSERVQPGRSRTVRSVAISSPSSPRSKISSYGRTILT